MVTALLFLEMENIMSPWKLIKLSHKDRDEEYESKRCCYSVLCNILALLWQCIVHMALGPADVLALLHSILLTIKLLGCLGCKKKEKNHINISSQGYFLSDIFTEWSMEAVFTHMRLVSRYTACQRCICSGKWPDPSYCSLHKQESIQLVMLYPFHSPFSNKELIYWMWCSDVFECIQKCLIKHNYTFLAKDDCQLPSCFF